MWGLIDCDNFFCSCERVFRPDLRDKPVVVLSNNDGCVVARSREVKAMGIPDIMPYFELLEKYPGSGITAFSSNYRLYGDLSARVMATLREEVPEVLQYSIDEAFLDLRGMESAVDLKTWGEALCRKVERWTGIPVSLGIAPTRTLAKMASRYAKTYAGYRKCCVIATPEQRHKALSLFPLEKVWGIGRRMGARLQAAGARTALDYAMKPRGWIRSRFHVTGERTWMELHGIEAIDTEAMESATRKSIVTSRSFPGMLTAYDDVRTNIANHAARCAMKLRRQHTVCRMVTVFIQSNSFRPDLPQFSTGGSYTFTTATATTTEITSAATGILRAIFRPGIHYKRGGVMVSDISSDAAIQPDLFGYDAALAARYRSLSEAIDEINARLGADTVIVASQQYRRKDASGKNVKFVNAIRRALKSPEYSTNPGDFLIH